MQVTGGLSPGPSDGLQLSVATLNVLADCYSHSWALGPELRWRRRKHGIRAVLTCCGADVLCLQELDHYEDFFSGLLRELGYEARYLQRPTRSDGCVIAWKPAVFDCLHELAMDLDKISSNHSWRKHNVALACQLRHRASVRTFIVCTTHLYWNPRRPEVKFAQARWVADSLHAWEHANGGDVPCVLAGDFNTLPDSDVYAVLTGTPTTTAGAASGDSAHDAEHAGEKKFLCDASLNRLCRWLRLCGVDTALETDDEERVRNEQKVFVLFERCKQEGRILLTSSKQLVARRKCPHCYLIDPKTLEESFVELCQHARIRLQRERLLTVCVKCNGAIVESTREAAMASGVNVPEGVEVFACSSCQQPYWWSDRENSGAVRAKRLADHLFDLVTNARPAVGSEAASRVGEWKGDEGDDDEEGGNSDGEDATCANDASDGRERLGSLDGSRKLFKSAYAEVHGAEPPYTNWTPTFLGTLDYIFVSEQWRCERAYIVPELALIPTSPRGSDVGVDVDTEVTNQVSSLSISAETASGAAAEASEAAEIAQAAAEVAVAFQQSVPGPFPCSNWPSDHMMLVASLVLG